MALLRPKRAIKAAARAGMARGAIGVHKRKKTVGVTIVAQLHQMLEVTRRSTFIPLFLTAARPTPRGFRIQRATNGLGIHPRHHEHGVILRVLHDTGNKSVLVKREFFDIHVHSFRATRVASSCNLR